MLQSTRQNKRYEKEGKQSRAPSNDLKKAAPGCSLCKAESPRRPDANLSKTKIHVCCSSLNHVVLLHSCGSEMTIQKAGNSMLFVFLNYAKLYILACIFATGICKTHLENVSMCLQKSRHALFNIIPTWAPKQ